MFQFLGLDQIAIDSPQKLAWQEKIHPKDDRETCVNRNFELRLLFYFEHHGTKSITGTGMFPVDKGVETNCSARLDLFAEVGSLFVIQ